MVTMTPDSSITPEMETAVYGSLSTLIKGYQALKLDTPQARQNALDQLPIIQASQLNPSTGQTISSKL